MRNGHTPAPLSIAYPGSRPAPLVTVLELCVALACAAGAVPVAAAADDAVDGIDEIVVTARKREERLVDTPISITAVTADDIARMNIKSLSGVAQQVPNMTFDLGTGSTGGSNNAQIYIRGVGQQDFLFTSDPGVGLYIDGVFFSRATGVIMDMADIQQVEVLRGPQGTLFGKNTVGGAIIVNSKQPGEERDGMVQAIAGSRDRTDLQGAVTIPMVPGKLSARLAASVRKQDGFVDRDNAGDESGDTDSQFARGVLRWTPDDSWDVNLALDVTRKREQSAPEELINVQPSSPDDALLFLWNLLVAPTYGAGVQYDNRFLSDEYESQGTGPNSSDFDMWGAALTLTHEFSDSLSFKSISAYRDQQSEFGSDTDHSPMVYTESTTDNEHRQFSQEFQLTGSSFGDRMDWVLGAFYMQEDGEDVSNYILGGGLYTALESLPGPFIPLGPVACPAPFPAPCAGGAGNPYNVALDLDVLISDDLDSDSYAAFGEANFALTDRLRLTTGLRYSYDEKDFETSLLRQTAGVVTVDGGTSDDWDNLSPRVSLDYRINDNAMVYASVTSGYKSGGFNGRSTSLEQIDSFDPETVIAQEIGTKLTTVDNRFGLNLSAFHSDYDDMQLLSVRDVQGVILVVTENAGKVKMDGFEAELFAVPVDGLNLRAGVGYLDAEYDELDAGASVTKDDRLVKAPEWTSSASIDYTFSLASAGTLMLAANASYRSSYVNELTNEPILVQDSFTLYGASLQYTEPRGRWSLTGFGINLGDERYMTNGLTSYGSFGNAVANFAPPREWGVKFALQF